MQADFSLQRIFRSPVLVEDMAVIVIVQNAVAVFLQLGDGTVDPGNIGFLLISCQGTGFRRNKLLGNGVVAALGGLPVPAAAVRIQGVDDADVFLRGKDVGSGDETGVIGAAEEVGQGRDHVDAGAGSIDDDRFLHGTAVQDEGVVI